MTKADEKLFLSTRLAYPWCRSPTSITVWTEHTLQMSAQDYRSRIGNTSKDQEDDATHP